MDVLVVNIKNATWWPWQKIINLHEDNMLLDWQPHILWHFKPLFFSFRTASPYTDVEPSNGPESTNGPASSERWRTVSWQGNEWLNDDIPVRLKNSVHPYASSSPIILLMHPGVRKNDDSWVICKRQVDKQVKITTPFHIWRYKSRPWSWNRQPCMCYGDKINCEVNSAGITYSWEIGE